MRSWRNSRSSPDAAYRSCHWRRAANAVKFIDPTSTTRRAPSVREMVTNFACCRPTLPRQDSRQTRTKLRRSVSLPSVRRSRCTEPQS
ncbi:MAG: hypothetical protein HOQ45_10200, partial [Nocardioidaceae bacterium]|nr:hypothetical protein [Nocardioidaceae bacterium]